MKPLHELLSSRNQWTWNDGHDTAFQDVKTALTSSETLSTYDPSLETVLFADTSSFGLGAVLQQRHDDVLHPVAYISRALTVTYAQIEKEALAITWACEQFHQHQNILISKIKPLKLILSHFYKNFWFEYYPLYGMLVMAKLVN